MILIKESHCSLSVVQQALFMKSKVVIKLKHVFIFIWSNYFPCGLWVPFDKIAPKKFWERVWRAVLREQVAMRLLIHWIWRGCKDKLFKKVLATQAWAPESNPQNHVQEKQCSLTDPVLGRQRQVDLQGSVASLPCLESCGLVKDMVSKTEANSFSRTTSWFLSVCMQSRFPVQERVSSTKVGFLILTNPIKIIFHRGF